MRRIMTGLLTVGALAGCRTYDNYSTTSKQQGLVPAATYARYGTEQAEVVAIGRSLAQWYVNDTQEGRAKQVEQATAFARTLPGVVTVVADTLNPRLTVLFESGWRTAVVPIDDGVPAETTLQPKAAK